VKIVDEQDISQTRCSNAKCHHQSSRMSRVKMYVQSTFERLLAVDFFVSRRRLPVLLGTCKASKFYSNRMIPIRFESNWPIRNFRISRTCRRTTNHAHCSTYGCRAFAISGPRIWYSLPDYLKDSKLSTSIFKRYLKTYFFARYSLDALVH